VPEVRPALAKDIPTVRALLEGAALPIGDLATARPLFLVALEGNQIVASGALQRFGTSALLRSVVVVPELRGSGLGRLIVRELERAALADGVEQLVLLTETARSFFAQQRYQVIDRKDAPPEMQQSEEFRTLCPASATCMAKVLASGT
jgi:N-acetylglutamate synthase-like GNAT family acetyltransferase